MHLLLLFVTAASSRGVFSDRSSGINHAATRGLTGEKNADDVDVD